MAHVHRTVSPVIAAVWLLVLACLALSVADNVRLRTKVATLSTALERAREVAAGPLPGSITTIDAPASGVVVREGLRDETTIVLVSSFNCAFCKTTMAVWRELASDLPNVRFVLLRVDGRPIDGTSGGHPYDEATFAFPADPTCGGLYRANRRSQRIGSVSYPRPSSLGRDRSSSFGPAL